MTTVLVVKFVITLWYVVDGVGEREWGGKKRSKGQAKKVQSHNFQHWNYCTFILHFSKIRLSQNFQCKLKNSYICMYIKPFKPRIVGNGQQKELEINCSWIGHYEINRWSSTITFYGWSKFTLDSHYESYSGQWKRCHAVIQQSRTYFRVSFWFRDN